jgi:hypothetical protein
VEQDKMSLQDMARFRNKADLTKSRDMLITSRDRVQR